MATSVRKAIQRTIQAAETNLYSHSQQQKTATKSLRSLRNRCTTTTRPRAKRTSQIGCERLTKNMGMEMGMQGNQGLVGIETMVREMMFQGGNRRSMKMLKPTTYLNRTLRTTTTSLPVQNQITIHHLHRPDRPDREDRQCRRRICEDC
jgi:hypothetical protein